MHKHTDPCIPNAHTQGTHAWAMCMYKQGLTLCIHICTQMCPLDTYLHTHTVTGHCTHAQAHTQSLPSRTDPTCSCHSKHVACSALHLVSLWLSCLCALLGAVPLTVRCLVSPVTWLGQRLGFMYEPQNWPQCWPHSKHSKG